jgi:hypothetical protein
MGPIHVPRGTGMAKIEKFSIHETVDIIGVEEIGIRK